MGTNEKQQLVKISVSCKTYYKIPRFKMQKLLILQNVSFFGKIRMTQSKKNNKAILKFGFNNIILTLATDSINRPCQSRETE